MIYLDHAATSMPKPLEVGQAMVEALNLGNAGRGAHGPALAGLRTAYQVRCRVAEFFGVPGGPQQVVFTAGATHALNQAIVGLLSPGDHVVTTAAEHNSVLRPLYRLEQQGVELSVVPTDQQGRISYEEMEKVVTPRTKAVVCTHASNVTGNVTDLQRVSRMCRANGALLVVDGAQSGGHLPLSMEGMGIDVLCLPGHKGLLGPQGIGLLCLRPGVELRPLLVGGSGIHSFSHTHPAALPDGLEAGTRNNPGIAGLGAGLEWLQTQGVERLWAQTQQRLRQLYEGLNAIPGVTIYGDWSTFHRAPVLAMNLDGWEAAQLSDVLYEEFDIATRPGAHCAPLMHLALGTGEAGAVRMSVGCSTTSEDVEAAVAAVAQLAKEG